MRCRAYALVLSKQTRFK